MPTRVVQFQGTTVRVFIPDPIDKAAAEKVMQKGLKSVDKKIRAAFDQYTRFWTHKPTWLSQTSYRWGTREAIVDVFLDDDDDSKVFMWVSDGTQPHRIPLEGTKKMAFSLGGTSKTTGKAWAKTSTRKAYTPKRGHSMGSSTPGDYVVAYVVNHPGIEGRHYEAAVQKKLRGPITTTFMNIFRPFINATKHGME